MPEQSRLDTVINGDLRTRTRTDTDTHTEYHMRNSPMEKYTKQLI